MTSILFPINWKPYPFQVSLWNYLISGGKKAVAVWHRRAGKDVLGLNWITLCALREIGTYWYVYPTYSQARMSVWDGVTLEGRPYMSFLPSDFVLESSQNKARIVFKNGSIIQFVGSDRYDKLRGSGIKGAVISEYSYHNPKAVSSVIEPMLLRSGGWSLYLYTPNDKPEMTHGEDLYLSCKKQQNEEDQNEVLTNNVFCDLRTIEDTTDHDGKPLVELKSLSSSSMTIEQIRREFYCDFEAYKYAKSKSRDGNTFASELHVAESSGRIAYFPHDAAYIVDTYWDIGIVDFTTIWFCQEKKDEVVVIDFYYNRNKPIEFYLNVLRSRGGYRYGKNVLPHDMNRREPVTLNTRLSKANEVADKLCFAPFVLGAKYTREEQIEEARNFLSKCKMDSKRCFEGIQALYDFNSAKVGTKRGSHSSFESDVASSFCYMAMQVKTKQERRQELVEENLQCKATEDNFNPLNF